MSSMFTTCPGCRMNLALTPKDLRVGQGYVRCGRCERVFNALLSLSEDVDETAEPTLRAVGTTTLPALDEDAAPPPAREPAYDLSDDADDPLAEGDGEVDVVERLPTGSYETIVMEGDTFLQTEEMVDEEEIDEQIQQIARQINDNETAADEAAAAQELDADTVLGNRAPLQPAWIVGASLLALLLLGQVVHHHRQALVTNAWLERPLAAIYQLFGVKLEPAWDLAAYDLRQLGGESLGDSTTIVLRASVHNRAPNSQPPPLIRAILQDRYGNAIATQAIAPQDYARSAAPSRMAPDQRLDAELHLEDANRQAVGFELDACLPAADGKLHCSNDP
ncbi:MAG: zinc-ribbon and DUF3426 domain-containing protein [Steroidobacteraceae bacterium]